LTAAENEAECFEDRAEGILREGKTDQRADAADALRALSEARTLAENLLRTQPGSTYWKSTLGLLFIRMSLQQRTLSRFDEAMELAAKGVAILKAVGKQENAQGFDLDAVATGLTIVEPEQLRDPRLAVECAERMVVDSNRQKPGFFLTLARAYRAAGQPEKAHAAAKEGLGLLPTPTARKAPFRVRKGLENELTR